MATTDYLPFATGGGANVDTQGNYAGSGYQTQGFQAGIAQSKQVNKVLRQASMMAAAWAGIAVSQGVSVPDDGNLGNLQTILQNIVLSIMSTNGIGPTTGDIKPSLKAVADPTWVLMNDGSIGNAASNATTRNNADTVNLFTLIWNNCSNTNAPTQDATGTPVGRGATAAADFAANRRIVLTKQLGRAMASAGAGAGLSTRLIGDTVGEENHTLTSTETPAVKQAANTMIITGGASPAGAGGPLYFFGDSFIQGGGASHNNMQPSSFVTYMIKL